MYFCHSSRNLIAVFFSVFILCLSHSLYAASDAPYSDSDIPESRSALSDEQKAIEIYNKGVKQRNLAWELSEKAKKSTHEKKRNKYTKKSKKSFEKSIKSFKSAVKLNPDLYQAHSSMGFAYRKTGKLNESLEAYEKALAIKPDYHEAIEYLAETHLHMAQYEKVEHAFDRLSKEHPKYALQLLDAIALWLPSQSETKDSDTQKFIVWFKSIY